MPSVEDVAARLRGSVLTPGSAGYDEARTVWNAAVDHRPRYVVRCAEVADVQAAVRAARDLGLPLGIRCGGHSAAGYGVPDGGLQIDLRGMQRVTVDPVARRAVVEGGALLGMLDAAAQEHGLATTAGVVSHTGVGGLTLGGGVGWLARHLGLTCDNVVAFEVVTAEGEVVRASADENPDLYWGLRGGGGNFGVVTRFELRLHEVGTRALVAEVDLDLDDGPDALRLWADAAVAAPTRATFHALARDGVLTLGVVWVGPPEAASPVVDVLRGLGTPLDRRVVESSYVDLQRGSDVPAGHGYRRYGKAHLLRDLPDGAIDAFLQHGVGSHDVSGTLTALGGAVGQVPADATAFPHRDAVFEYNGGTRWTDPSEDAARQADARRLAAGLDPFGAGVYVNAIPDEGAAGVRRSYGPRTLDRLGRVKARWDPDNTFRLNHNVLPAP